MKNIYLAQVNYRYGNNAFLPYSVGRLWAYAMEVPEVAEQYQLRAFLWERREPILTALSLDNPSVVGISHYVWNAEWNKAFAKAVKRLHPECTVVAGGPQVPDRPAKVTDEFEYFDMLIHGEGEQAFVDVLLGKLSPGHHVSSRMTSLDALPSPYLSGVFDHLLSACPDIDWQASQETNRGCPYQCRFCDWGSDTYSKVRKFPIEKIVAEIRWMGQHCIGMAYNCDANFGMLEQDEAITRALIAAKGAYGYPKQFRAAYAKKTTPRVFGIGKALSDAGMCKGVTLSMQSMSEDVQKAIKRSNIPMAQFGKLMREYKDAGVQTYSELILGLTGETRESFIKGVCEVFELGQHDGLNIYPCMLLLNSEMSEDKEIQTVDVPMILNHASVEDRVIERYKLVIATPTMPYEHWLDSFAFAWFAQVMHVLGAARVVAMELRKQLDESYHRFYTKLFDDVKENRELWPILGEELASVVGRIHGVVMGQLDSWGAEIDGISWPIEEASFLRIMGQYDDFLSELRPYLANVYGSDDFACALIDAQYDRIKKTSEFEDYARQVVWYGRKGGSMIK